MATISSTVAGTSEASEGRCGTYPRRHGSRRSVGSAPNRRTVPERGCKEPSRVLSRVDLPDPFGPTSATNSPGRTWSETSSSTDDRPYENETAVADSSGVVATAVAASAWDVERQEQPRATWSVSRLVLMTEV